MAPFIRSLILSHELVFDDPYKMDRKNNVSSYWAPLRIVKIDAFHPSEPFTQETCTFMSRDLCDEVKQDGNETYVFVVVANFDKVQVCEKYTCNAYPAGSMLRFMAARKENESIPSLMDPLTAAVYMGLNRDRYEQLIEFAAQKAASDAGIPLYTLKCTCCGSDELMIKTYVETVSCQWVLGSNKHPVDGETVIAEDETSESEASIKRKSVQCMQCDHIVSNLKDLSQFTRTISDAFKNTCC